MIRSDDLLLELEGSQGRPEARARASGRAGWQSGPFPRGVQVAKMPAILMPPPISLRVNIAPALYEKISAYRHEAKHESRGQALTCLLRAGLITLQAGRTAVTRRAGNPASATSRSSKRHLIRAADDVPSGPPAAEEVTIMASVRKEIETDARVQDVGRRYGDIGAQHTRLVPDCCHDLVEPDPGRDIGNGLEIREPIVDLDDSAQRLVWSAEGAGTTHYNASVQVFEGTDRGSQLYGLRTSATQPKGPIETMMEQGMAVMKTWIDWASRQAA